MYNKKYRYLAILWLLICCVASVYYIHTKIQKTDYQTYFAVLPHFTIQPAIIDRAYKNILDTYTLSWKSLQIVLISPDHFNEQNSNILHQKIIDKPVCFQNVCLPIHAIYIDNEKNIPDTQIKEHWWWAHFPFIKKYFPQAKISLVKLSPRNFTALNSLYIQLRQLEKNDNLLVIASVDFSHYISEERAYVHDLKSYYTLVNATNQIEYTSIEVDCPTCLYLVNTRAKKEQQYPQLIHRDSSSTLMNKDLYTGNTSREFIVYTGKQSQENGIVLWFFGDLMFDRWPVNYHRQFF